MRYVGGKSRLASDIAEAILTHRGDRTEYLEPFIGGGAVFAKVAPLFKAATGSDISPDLAKMWSAVANGWLPPSTVSENLYASLKHEAPSALRGFAGFGCSFGGKWFGGFARGGNNADGTPRNHQAESARRVERMAPAFVGATILQADYRSFQPGPNVVVYCDPPYAGTQGYAAADGFDSGEFWQTVTAWADGGAFVIVSEYSGADGWCCLDERAHRQSLQHGKAGRPKTVERLWVREAAP